MNNKPINTPNKNLYCFLFYKNQILLKEGENCPQFPLISDIERLEIDVSNIIYIGTFDGKDYYTIYEFTKDNIEGFFFKDMRELYEEIDENIFFLTLRALHMINWLSKNRYCGCCGNKVKIESKKTSIKCLNCGHTIYPYINPAIIVAVLKEDKILLARSSHFPPNLFSLISGFVDPGETLETTVKREVKEEVGIEIKNIKYFGTHPWPFPNSLMIGYIAEYAAGEITIDNNEIESADWFSLDDLPNIPEYKLSFSRKIIDNLLEARKNNQ